MNLNELIKDPKSVERGFFGQTVRSRREELGILLREVAKDLGCSAVYISDIELGNKFAPQGEKLKKLEEILKIPEDQIQAFEDLASLNRGSYSDLQPYLEKTHEAVLALRTARDKNYTNEDWIRVMQQYKR